MRKFLQNTFLISASVLMGFSMTGCEDYSPEFDIQKHEHKEFQETGLFDFAMSHDVAIKIDFNRPSANNPVWIYDQYPYDEEGDMKPGVEPIYAFFLNDGAYNGAFHPATALDRVWVVCGGMGLPMLTQAEIKNGEISIGGESTRAVIPVTGTVTDSESRVMMTSDYSYKRAAESSLVEKLIPTTPEHNTSDLNTRRDQVYDRLYTLYDWTISGKPLASSSSSSTPESAPEVSAVWNYSQEDAAFVKTGDWSQYEIPGDPTTVDATYNFTATREWQHGFFLQKEGVDNSSGFKKIEIADQSAGMIRIYQFGNHSKGTGRNFGYDGSTKAEPITYCGGDVSYFEHTFVSTSVNHYIEPSGNSGYILYMEYYKEGETTPVTCYVDENHEFVQSTAGFYTMTEGTASTNHTPFVDYTATFPNTISRYLTLPYNDVSNGIELNIDPKDKGTVRVYYYDVDNFTTNSHTKSDGSFFDSRFNIEGQSVKLPESTEKEPNIRFGERVCNKDVSNNITANSSSERNNFKIVYVEYTSAAGQKYYCYFDASGKLVQNRAGFFSLSSTLTEFGNTQKKMPGANVPQTVTVGGNTYDHCLLLSSANKLTVTVPAYAVADLKLVFAENEKASIKLDGASQSSTNNTLTCKLENPTSSDKSFVVTRNSNDLHLFYASLVPHLDNNSEADWYQKTDYTNNVYKYRNINDPEGDCYNGEFQQLVNRLSNTLWRKTGSKSNAKATYGDTFNQEYASSESNKSDLIVEANTSVFVTFIGEYDTFSANTFGYYVYPTTNRPTSIDEIDKMFIIFPNCTSTDYTSSRLYKQSEKVDGNTVYNYSREDLVPLKCGDQVQIMFPNADGTYQKEFPLGYSIGWFVIYNGFDAWDLKNNTTTTGHVRLGALNNDGYGRKMMDTRIYFADPNLNQLDPSDVDGTATQSRCVQLTDKKANGSTTDYIALCFEDSYSTKGDEHSGTQDRTYDDLIFTVKGKLTNPSGQYTDGDENSYISYREEGIYAFEDIWDGSQTDFDMNDVAVQYCRTYSIHHCPDDLAKNNHIAKVDEVYTVLNDGATYEDAFAVELPYPSSAISSIMYKEDGKDPVQLSTTVTNDKPYLEYDGAKVSIVMFNNINNIQMGQKYSFEINFSSPLETTNVGSASNGTVSTMTSSYNRASYNPYIIVANYMGTPEKRCEIHLPTKETTSKGVVPMNQYNSNNRWYVVKLEESLYSGLSGEGLKVLPFAIDIPTTSFKGCREGVFVTTDYPQFFNWAKSGGTTNTNWYSNPNSEATWQLKR